MTLNSILPCSFFFPDPFTETITGKEIFQVAENAGLTRNKLHKLFKVLDIPDREVENAERNADTRDVVLQADKVLQHWRTIRGSAATKWAILEALEECGYVGAIEILRRLWDM